MRTVNVSTSIIKTAPYNPQNRTKQVTQLLASIKSYGILVPLILDSEKNLIDGHRRLHCAKKLKITEVPTIELSSKITKDKAFEIINTTSKKISNHDMFYIYVHGGSVPDKTLTKIKELELLIGKTGIRKLSNKNVTSTILTYAKMVQKYCKSTDSKFLIKTLYWLADYKMIYYVRRAMEARIKADIIATAINKNKPLQVSYK